MWSSYYRLFIPSPRFRALVFSHTRDYAVADPQIPIRASRDDLVLSSGAETAAMREPYVGTQNTGVLIHETAELTKKV